MLLYKVHIENFRNISNGNNIDKVKDNDENSLFKKIGKKDNTNLRNNNNDYKDIISNKDNKNNNINLNDFILCSDKYINKISDKKKNNNNENSNNNNIFN